MLLGCYRADHIDDPHSWMWFVVFQTAFPILFACAILIHPFFTIYIVSFISKTMQQFVPYKRHLTKCYIFVLYDFFVNLELYLDRLCQVTKIA